MPILGSQGGLSSRGFGQFTETLPPPTAPVDGYHLWLDADHAPSFTYSSGTSVSQWTDRSANGFTFTTAATVNQPSRSGVQNGKSTVIFDGIRDYLKSTAPASTWRYFHDGTPVTLFFVLKSNEVVVPGSSMNSSLFSTFNSYPGMDFSIYIPSDAVYPQAYMGVYNVSGVNYYRINSSNIFNSAYDIYTYKLDVNNASPNSKLLHYRNSSSSFGSNFGPFDVGTTVEANSSLYIGTAYDGFFANQGTTYPQYMFSGEIAEILVYKSLLSDLERTANVNYLKAKWNIPSNIT